MKNPLAPNGSSFPDAVKIEPGSGFEGLKNTFRAMLQGAPAIYQPQLWDLRRDVYGKADLLLKDSSSIVSFDGPSTCPCDFLSARDMKQ